MSWQYAGAPVVLTVSLKGILCLWIFRSLYSLGCHKPCGHSCWWTSESENFLRRKKKFVCFTDWVHYLFLLPTYLVFQKGSTLWIVIINDENKSSIIVSYWILYSKSENVYPQVLPSYIIHCFFTYVSPEYPGDGPICDWFKLAKLIYSFTTCIQNVCLKEMSIDTVCH
jgi:hypothetical protein